MTLIVMSLVVEVACSSGGAPPASATLSPTPTTTVLARLPTPTPPSQSATATPALPTAGSLATAGKAVFAEHCATCHGDRGQGLTAPANIGPNANLAKFGTAEGLLTYVSAAMPQDRPGSLSSDEYFQVVSYLLVENQLVQPGMPLTRETLGRISLTR